VSDPEEIVDRVEAYVEQTILTTNHGGRQ